MTENRLNIVSAFFSLMMDKHNLKETISFIKNFLSLLMQ